MGRHMTFTASGDAMIIKPLPPGYPGFEPISQFLKKGEARITNLETTLTDGLCFPSEFSGGSWLTANPSVLDDLSALGFNLYGWANNHTLDYSYGGLESTRKALEAAGVAHAGAGRNIVEASRPAMIDLPSGRVGFIDICSTFNPSARAGEQAPFIQGRPGINPLRFTVTNYVSRNDLDALAAIERKTFLSARNRLAEQQGYKAPPPEGVFEFGAMRFALADGKHEEGRYSEADTRDVKRTVAAIKDALLICDYVVVMVHSHEVKTDSHKEADYFLEEFCRACIDAGASVIFGGGTHQLKGIEIYNGKPIFYSLGNFIFLNEYVKDVPYDFIAQMKLPYDISAAKAIASRPDVATGATLHQDKANFLTVIPLVEMVDDTCVSILLQPVTLGWGKGHYFRNIPYPSDEKDSKEILEYLKDVSAPYKTQMSLRSDGLIEVLVK